MATALERVLAGGTQVDSRPADTPSRLPLLLVPVALALVGAGWVRVDDDASAHLVMSLVVVTWLAAGAVLSARRPREPLGLLLMALATVAALGTASTAASGPFADLATRLVAGLLPFAGLHVLVTLPDGSFAARSHRTVVLAGYATGALVGLMLWVVRP